MKINKVLNITDTNSAEELFHAKTPPSQATLAGKLKYVESGQQYSH